MKKTFKYITLIFSAAIFFACGNGDEQEISIPPYVLSEEKYIKLLVDFSLAESAGNLNIKNYTGTKFDSAYAFNPLKENNVSQSLYDSTLSFYSKHPKLYKKMCEEVLVILSKMQITRETVKKDSALDKKILLKADQAIEAVSKKH